MAFRELKDEQFPSHDFAKEKIVEGVLVEKREGVGPNKSWLFVVEKAGGVKESVWGSSVLDKLSRVAIGSMIRIEFVGEVKGKGPRPYKNYKIMIDDSTVSTEELAKNEFGI